MAELLTAAQMRAIEEAAIASGEVTGLKLMERAGAGVVEAIFEEWPELGNRLGRAVVLCGPGNNGGDGFVVARLLRERGWQVEVFLYGDAENLPPDARANFERWREMGEVLPMPLGEKLFPSRFKLHQEPEVIVDALFGTGLARPIDPALSASLAGLSSLFPSRFSRWVGVDVPSGLCSDSGRFLGDEVLASVVRSRLALTVSFHSPKVGHFLATGPEQCGRIVVKPIGLGVARGSWEERTHLTGTPDTTKPSAHKYTHGHALILSGGAGRTGAARLAARGALRIGAGLVTIGVPGAAQLEVAAQVTAIMLRRAGTPDEAAAVLEDRRINALCLGPGMGVERAREIVPVALASRRASVLDADALTAFEEDPQALFDLLHEDCILTPHGGEFRRLFPDIAERMDAPVTRGPAYSKVDATRAAARRAGCVVLFKGPDTVIAHPDGRCCINSAAYDRAAPWLATAGSGDVLAGFITGLLARGFGAMQAAGTGAWLHVEAALRFGPGLIAEDLPEELPKVFSALEI